MPSVKSADAAPAQPEKPRPSRDGRAVGRLLLLCATTFALVSGGLAALALNHLRSQTIASGERFTESLARLLEEQTSRTLQTVDQRLELAANSLAQRAAGQALEPEPGRQLLRAQIADLPHVRAMWTLDPQGRILYDSDIGNMGLDLSERPYFRVFQAQAHAGLYIGSPVRSRTTGTWLIAVARALPATDGKFAGVIVAALEPRYLDRLWHAVQLGPDSSVALLRQDGVMMMRSPIVDAAMGKAYPEWAMFSGSIARSPAGSFHTSSAVDGRDRLFAFRALPGHPDLKLVVGQSYELLLAPWRRLAAVTAAVWGVGVAAVTMLCVFLAQAWRRGSRSENQARRMVERVTLAADAASIGIWDRDLASGENFATSTYLTMLGYDPAEGLGTAEHWHARVHPQDRDAALRQEQAALDAPEAPYAFEARMRHADGSYRWVKTSGRVVARDCAGKATRVVGVRMDITQSKQSTQQLACANDALRAVNRTLNVVVECNQALVRATTEQQLLDEMCRILVQRGDHLLAWVGMARRDAGKSVSVTASHGATRYLESLDTTWGDDALGQGPTGTAIRTMQAVVNREPGADPHYAPWRAAAESFGIRSSIGLPIGTAKPALGVLNIYSADANRFNAEEMQLLLDLARNITYGIQSLRAEALRREAEAALLQSRTQLQALSRRVLVTQETERRRIAHDLHDELGQSLTAIKINLQARERFMDVEPHRSHSDNLHIIEDAIQKVRGLALSLRPSILDDLGLVPALRWISEQTAARSGLEVRFQPSVPPIRFAPEVETTCFRIVQEALTNIGRHAQARHVDIDLLQDAGSLLLCVQDDGVGFDLNAMRNRALAGGSIGVLGMQERAALVGGRLEIITAPGRGCTLRLRCPWQPLGEKT